MMRGSQNTTTIVIALVIAFFLAVLDWFFLLQPKMSATSEARAATESQLLTNSDLEIRLQKLKVDFENLPALKEAMWSIRDQFPVDIDADAIRDQFSALDDQYGIYLQSESIGTAIEVAPGGVSLAPAFAAFGLESYSDALTFTSLAAAPVTITIQGRYDAVMGYLDDLQVGDHRYFLFSNVTVTAVAEDSGAVPPALPGDIQVTAAGYVFVLEHGVPEATSRPAPPALPGEEPLPSERESAPSNDRNFFSTGG